MASTDLMKYFYEGDHANSIPIQIVFQSEYKEWKSKQEDSIQNWIQTSCFKPKPNHHLCIPNAQGNLDSVLVIAGQENTTWSLGSCPHSLPEGRYHIATKLDDSRKDSYFLGWGLGSYQYHQYKKNDNKACKLSINDANDKNRIEAVLKAVALVRDLVNTPASDMLPQNLSKHCQSITQDFDTSLNEYVGHDLLKNKFPVIHAVGRASVHPPRLIEWSWGNSKHPRVTLIGKGVSFDSGGLDIKSAQGMRIMKKDMGGAAHVMGIATVVMQMNLPIRLQVLIPAVENAISGDAYRPGDVLVSRCGKTIEIENTDAEGRLILCDAISKAVENSPEILIDFATLTGAARVALGTEVPAFFTNDDTLADDLKNAAEAVEDPVWQLPLYKPYRYLLNSDIADISNCSTGSFGGAITAALFLKEFVPETIRWVHFDVMAWNTRNRPGRPKGGEAMGLRTIVEFLQNRYLK